MSCCLMRPPHFCVQLVERNAFRGGGGEHLDGDRDQAERDGSGSDGMRRHKRFPPLGLLASKASTVLYFPQSLMHRPPPRNLEPPMPPRRDKVGKRPTVRGFHVREGRRPEREGRAPSRAPARGLPEEARPGTHPGAVWRRRRRRPPCGRPRPSRRALRRPAALGAQPPLRPAPRDGRRPQELGGPQGPVGAGGGEAARGARRGPSARVRQLRRRDPVRQLRRRLGDRVGPRHLPLVQARADRASSTRAASSSWSCSGTSWAAAGRSCA